MDLWSIIEQSAKEMIVLVKQRIWETRKLQSFKKTSKCKIKMKKSKNNM
jgi:hypothetical protein